MENHSTNHAKEKDRFFAVLLNNELIEKDCIEDFDSMPQINFLLFQKFSNYYKSEGNNPLYQFELLDQFGKPAYPVFGNYQILEIQKEIFGLEENQICIKFLERPTKEIGNINFSYKTSGINRQRIENLVQSLFNIIELLNKLKSFSCYNYFTECRDLKKKVQFLESELKDLRTK